MTASFPAAGVGEGEVAFKALFIYKQSAEGRPNNIPPAAINNRVTPPGGRGGNQGGGVLDEGREGGMKEARVVML